MKKTRRILPVTISNSESSGAFIHRRSILIEQLRSRMARVPLRTLIIPGRGDQSYGEHEAILAALKSKRADDAESKAKTHIKSLKEVIRTKWSLIRN